MPGERAESAASHINLRSRYDRGQSALASRTLLPESSMSLRPILIGLFCTASLIGRVSPQTPDLYEGTVLRTLDLTFSQSNWYQILEQNHGTGVDLAADLTVDGVTYPNVGVRFRGFSS